MRFSDITKKCLPEAKQIYTRQFIIVLVLPFRQVWFCFKKAFFHNYLKMPLQNAKSSKSPVFNLKNLTNNEINFRVKHYFFLCPRHKMARGHLVFALSVIPSFRPSVIPSFRPSVALKFVFLTPPTSLHGFE